MLATILPTYHTGPVLWRSIDAILAEPRITELIIVNNGNPKPILDRLKKRAQADKRITLLTGHGNIGFAAACNKGVKAANSDTLLLLNPDCILLPGSLETLEQALEQHPGHTLVSGAITHPDGTEQAGSRRNLLTPLTALVESLNLHRLYKGLTKYRLNLHETPADHDSTIPVLCTSGAVMLFRRDTYQALNGMDERYFLHVEDLDFCKRLHDIGGAVLQVPAARIIHYRSTSDASSTIVEHHKTKGFIQYFNTHYPYHKEVLLAIYVRYYLKRLMLALTPRRATDPQQIALRTQHLNAIPTQSTGKGEVHTIAITGASGQLGIALIRKLLAAGHRIIAFYHRTVLDVEHPNLTWLFADLNHPLPDMEPYQVTHFIHTTSCWLLPDHIEQLAKQGIGRLVAVSSHSVETKQQSPNHADQYLVKKIKNAEQQIIKKCKKYNIPYTLFRPTMIYGLELDTNITRLTHWIKHYRILPLYPPAKGLRQPLHADDLAQAIQRSLTTKKACNQTYTLGGPEQLTYSQLVIRLYHQQHQRPKILYTKLLPLLLTLTRQNPEIAHRMNQDLICDNEKAEKELGVEREERVSISD